MLKILPSAVALSMIALPLAAQAGGLPGRLQVGNTPVPLGTGNAIEINAITPEHTGAKSVGIHLLGSDHTLAAQAPLIRDSNGKPLDLRLSTPLDPLTGSLLQ